MTSILTKTRLGVPTVKRKAKMIGVVVTLLIAAVGMWSGSAIWQAGSKVFTQNQSGGSILFQKNASDVIPTELKGEGDGRINILLIGIDNAAGLADVLQVLSIDTQNKKAALLSIPRDLWVKIPGYGFNKINASHSLPERVKKDSGPEVVMATVSDLLDLPIHYYARLNFQGLKGLVDAVGGITVDVPGPLDDYEFPDNNEGYLPPVHIKPGVQTMNGTTALIYARSRHAINPGEGSDFARSRRQQLVMFALKDKATSLGFLANPLKLNQALTTVGNNMRTNLAPNELQQLIKMFQNIETTKIITKVLDTDAGSPLQGEQQDERGYIITPRDGDFSYKGVKQIAHEIFTDPYLAREKSRIEVRNASSRSGLSLSVSATLKSYGYNVVKITTSSTKEPYTELINYAGSQYPFTLSFLERRYKLKARTLARPSGETSDIVLVLGADYDTATSGIGSAKSAHPTTSAE